MKINGAQLLIKLLEEQGTQYIAGIPGGANLPIYDALTESSMEHILVRHEQAAGFIAQGISRTSRMPGVCLATSGPGATNLLTALADAFADSIPLIAITGQVSRSLIGTRAFQEVDICAMAGPAVKKTFQIRNAAQLLDVIPAAFREAMQDCPGPVLIDIPRDVQTEILEVHPDDYYCHLDPDHDSEPGKFGDDPDATAGIISRMISESRRPLLYIGGGIIRAGASMELREFISRFEIPAVSTLMGLGAIEHNNPCFLGMLGMHGTIKANLALDEADLVLVIGARFDDRATGKFDEFCRHAKLIHIDINPMSDYKGRVMDFIWKEDAKTALQNLNRLHRFSDLQLWHSEIHKLQENSEYQTSIIDEDIGSFDTTEAKSAATIIRNISECIAEDDIIVTDVGQHQMWVAQYFPFRRPGNFLTSGGLGTMGFGLPAAIGAALARRQQNVICFTGDGSIMMNIQELATINELNLNIKIILFNNGHLGLVRQQQHLFFNQNYMASCFKTPADFVQISHGFGIRSERLTGDFVRTDLREIWRDFLSAPGPCLLEFEIDHHEKVFPMVPPGKANRTMLVSNPGTGVMRSQR